MRTNSVPARAIVAVAALVGSVVPVLTQGPGGGRGGGQAMSLPDGPGKDLAQTQCTKCHALNLLANSGGYTRQGWEELFDLARFIGVSRPGFDLRREHVADALGELADEALTLVEIPALAISSMRRRRRTGMTP